MKKVLGYGYKRSGETVVEALEFYNQHMLLHKTKQEALENIEKDKANLLIDKREKPRIFKVVVEVL